MSLIIGVSGASSSGKTTVAKTLRDLFPNSILLHEDDFYYPDDQIPFNQELQEYDWDCPEAVNFEKLKDTLRNFKRDPKFQFTESSKESVDVSITLNPQIERKIKETVGHLSLPRIVFIDGFLLYHDREILDLLDVCLFYKTDYDTLKNRRQNRQYTIDNGIWTDPPGYFEKIVWPQYYKNHTHLFENAYDNEQQLKENTAKINSIN
ncbi:uncharacterized protein OGAPODRAFT_91905 [Ogataea polymorpha]|uniref:uncharacterized protein n=1 Tax=Ogataea polymorpha TaxID=460523 RepID=UPI0007F413E7|nr:uncharacterized protein OGAPODRAFT_91905 [Ogataea polymorpha]OBA18417.1 hypothetical protein OGAPODRAFT_91905 [Ogataea polymorpha]